MELTVPVQDTGNFEPVAAVSGAVTVTAGAVISMGVVASVLLPSRRT